MVTATITKVTTTATITARRARAATRNRDLRRRLTRDRLPAGRRKAEDAPDGATARGWPGAAVARVSATAGPLAERDRWPVPRGDAGPLRRFRRERRRRRCSRRELTGRRRC